MGFDQKVTPVKGAGKLKLAGQSAWFAETITQSKGMKIAEKSQLTDSIVNKTHLCNSNNRTTLREPNRGGQTTLELSLPHANMQGIQNKIYEELVASRKL